MIKQFAHQRNNSPIPIYANSILIGRVVGDTFHKNIKNKHMLDKPKAIGFDRGTLRDAAEAGATRAAIYNSETSTTYRATFDTIHTYGFPVRRGHGDQLHLTIDHWSINGALPVAEQRAAATNREREDMQLSLFGETV